MPLSLHDALEDISSRFFANLPAVMLPVCFRSRTRPRLLFACCKVWCFPFWLLLIFLVLSSHLPSIGGAQVIRAHFRAAAGGLLVLHGLLLGPPPFTAQARTQGLLPQVFQVFPVSPAAPFQVRRTLLQLLEIPWQRARVRRRDTL